MHVCLVAEINYGCNMALKQDIVVTALTFKFISHTNGSVKTYIRSQASNLFIQIVSNLFHSPELWLGKYHH